MKDYEKSINLYGDNIGRVDYVSHMGSDLTVVNSARVSFGTTKSEFTTVPSQKSKPPCFK